MSDTITKEIERLIDRDDLPEHLQFAHWRTAYVDAVLLHLDGQEIQCWNDANDEREFIESWNDYEPVVHTIVRRLRKFALDLEYVIKVLEQDLDPAVIEQLRKQNEGEDDD